MRAIVEMPLTDLGLGTAVRIEAVGCETGLPVDDVGVAVSGGGFILVQAKAGMRRLDVQAEDLVKAIDQIVRAFVEGIHTSAGVRPVDLSRDRLVIATNHDGSRAFDQLGIVLLRLRGHPADLPLRAAAPTIGQRRTSARSAIFSVRAGDGVAAFGTYAASKAAIRSFARTWANELKGRNIRVNAISPGTIDTPGLDGVVATEDTPVTKSDFAAAVPLGRIGRPDEVANVVAFLASDQGSFFLGANLVVDGGEVHI
ncbi:SDR family oxidoreductase [Nonomuraea sp. NPDC050643]|uniref:SDR family NAD(P)-dependent oxidoreductase n=1 Tax=Nonomuraea sp. NPDC050643 TaxID=3155660 RepID=UPI0033F6D175